MLVADDIQGPQLEDAEQTSISQALWLGQRDLELPTAQGRERAVVYPNWTTEAFWTDPSALPSTLSTLGRGHLRSQEHPSWVECSLFLCGLARKHQAGWPRGWPPWLKG